MLSRKAKSRLTRLIEFMETLPPEANKHFYMGAWIDHRGEHDHHFDHGKSVTQKDLLSCGTTACAMGWAATVPSFKKAGLQMYVVDTAHGVDADFSCPESSWNTVTNALTVAELFFDITHGQAQVLFGGHADGVTTPKKWAKFARENLRDWEEW